MSLRSGGMIIEDLMSNASACVRTLRAAQTSPSEQVNLDLVIGTLWCLEVQAHMSGDLTDMGSRPPEAFSRPSEDGRLKWMASQVEYGKICLRIVKPHDRNRDGQHSVQVLEDDLRIWKASLLGQYHDIDQPYPRNFAFDSRKLWVFCQFHEAILHLYDGLGDNDFDGMDGSLVPGFRSARTVLEATSLLTPSMVLSNR